MDIYLKTALDCCKLITNNYSTSFSLGIRLLRKKYRKAIYGIYGFVRLADEIVDTFHDFDSKELLRQFMKDTYQAIDEKISTNPILHSFQWAVNTYSIDRELIEAFLHSMEMDLTEKKYSHVKYKTYIYGSAEVVGLMCLQVYYFGDRQQFNQLKDSARFLGRAFQQVNFLRDLKEDYLQRGRIYFPGINFEKLTIINKRGIEDDIEKNFREAFQGIKMLKKGVRLGVYCAYIYYLELFQKIKNLPPERIMKCRIRINNYYKFWLLIKSSVLLLFLKRTNKEQLKIEYVLD